MLKDFKNLGELAGIWILIIFAGVFFMRGFDWFCEATHMKKIKRRKGKVALMALGAVLLYMGGHSLWDGTAHVGSGVWVFGGDEPGTGGAAGTDEYQDVIPENEYKRQCYVYAAMFFLFGGFLLWGVIKWWKERNDLEKTWGRMILDPNCVQDIRRHPEAYRDDFKQWIKEIQPDLILPAKDDDQKPTP